ncbi:tetratricopeptide repeat-containing sensor histidine kinase [Polaribacter porphyrae]|nr:ATP-binding protein [Polaribacter porphyrae]
MKKIIFILLFIINQSFSFGQDDSIPNLLKAYKQTKDSTLIQKALRIANKKKNDSLIREVNIVYGIESYRKNDLKNLKKSEINLLRNYKRFYDSLSLAKYYHYKALNFRKRYVTDSCFYYYHKSKNISILLKDSLAVGRRLLSMARIQEREKDYLGSEITSIKALRYLEPIKPNRYVSYCYNNLGLILSKMGRYNNARQNYLKSYKIGYLNNDLKLLNVYIDYHNNTASTYQLEKFYEKSNEYYLKIIKDSIKKKSPTRFYNGIENIAYNNFKIGKYNEALKGFLKTYNYRKSINDTRRLTTSYSILAEYYLSQKNYKKAKNYALMGVRTAKKTNYTKRILENYNYLSKIEKGEKGKSYLRKIIKLNDSILTSERNLKDQFAKIIYETEKKELENNSLKAENEKKELQLEKEQQQKVIGWLVASGFLLILAFGYVIVTNRRKKLLFESKLKQVEAREKERQQIAKSLHDEVAGDIRVLHKKLAQNNLIEESKELDRVKENVRNLSHQLSSVSFDEVSFKDQIVNLMSDYFDANFSIKVHGINTVNWATINKSIKRTLFLSIRESIQNAEKYANAKIVILDFTETKKEIILKIKDDGIGFDLKKQKSGIGLKNMKERIEDISGIFMIESEENKGTTLIIRIPKNGK